MWRKITSIICALVVITGLFSACEQKIKRQDLPKESEFSVRIEVASVKKTAENKYVLCVKAVLTNHSDRDWVIYGNPTCWSEIFVNGRGENQDLPLGSYALESGAELIEEKEILLSAEEWARGEMYAQTSFYIEFENEQKQYYKISSEKIFLSEMKENV